MLAGMAAPTQGRDALQHPDLVGRARAATGQQQGGAWLGGGVHIRSLHGVMARPPGRTGRAGK